MDTKAKHSKIPGFSFVELCLILSIIGCLFTFGLPYLNCFLMRQEREFVLKQLITTIEYAKQEAFRQGSTLTLCPSIDGKNCQLTRDWSHGFLLVSNHSPKQQLLTFPGIHHGKLYFDEFSNHLNIKANGSTINTGTFTYCPNNKDPREPRGLVINRASRVYSIDQKNTLGIPLKNAGTIKETPLICR